MRIALYEKQGWRRGESHQKAKHPDSVVKELCERVDAGETRQKVARELGVPYSTARDWHYGWTRDSRGGVAA